MIIQQFLRLFFLPSYVQKTEKISEVIKTKNLNKKYHPLAGLRKEANDSRSQFLKVGKIKKHQ
jgi:hypothetical protein